MTKAETHADDSKAATLVRPRMAFADGHFDLEASRIELVLSHGGGNGEEYGCLQTRSYATSIG